MKEHPILFSTPMIQAILAGKKTQTRRVVKGIALDWLQPDMFTPEFVASEGNDLCPYGQVGDILWVRETWQPERGGIRYRADYPGMTTTRNWKPSIHMPRKYSRINLEIISITVERLQDISASDAYCEGIENLLCAPPRCGLPEWTLEEFCSDSVKAFKKLWESINGEDSCNDNPWVWVIEFRKI